MQGTRARFLLQEDPTCRGATKPVHYNYWARAPQLVDPHVATTETRVLYGPRAATTEPACCNYWSPRA